MDKCYKYIKTDTHTLMGIIFLFILLMDVFILYRFFNQFTPLSLMMLIPTVILGLYLLRIVRRLFTIHTRAYVILSQDKIEIDRGVSLRKVSFSFNEIETMKEDLYGLRLDFKNQRSITIKHTILSIQDFEEIKEYLVERTEAIKLNKTP